MDPKKDIYDCKGQIVQELRRIATAKNSYPKRHKPERVPRPNVTRFEDVFPRLQSKWTKSINALFYSIKDQGIYDKLAYDLMKPFHKLYTDFNFNGEQLSNTFRRLIRPILGHMMDESELGRKAYERQDRRKQFLRKLLTHGFQQKQNSDGPEDERSTSQSEMGGAASDQPEDVPIKLVKPTPISIIILDLLIDALLRHNNVIAQDENSSKERILHVMNINHVIDLVSKYYNEIKENIENERTYGRAHNLNVALLSQSIERYEVLLWNALETLPVLHPLTVWRTQLDSLLLQSITIKPLLR